MMRSKTGYALIAAMLLSFCAAAAWSQATLTAVEGVVTDNGKPAANVQVVLTHKGTGRPYVAKTDKDGRYSMLGLTRGDYEVQINGSNKQALYHENTHSIIAEGKGTEQVNFEIGSGGDKKMSKEQIDAIKAQNAKAEGMNALISQAKAALDAKNYEAAVAPLTQLTEQDPSDYEFPMFLGNAQYNLGRYDEAVASFEKAIQLAQNTQPDSKKAYSDPTKIKTALGQMLTNQGNAYLKLKKDAEAKAAFKKASQYAGPAAAYNLCVVNYNAGNADEGIPACEEATKVDPNNANAYFLKGSLMMQKSTQGKDGKVEAPAGTAEALNKYLELAPDGPHANDAKAMIQFIGAKIETTYKAGKKK
jgi:tetratricopeptide (TPR) repeat protein